MDKTLYYFDPSTSQYKRAEITIAKKAFNVSRIAFISSALAAAMVVGYSSYFELPREIILKKDIADLEDNFKKIDTELGSLNDAISAIEQRDDNVYRAVMGAEPLDHAVREGGIGGTDRYQDLHNKKVKDGELFVKIFARINKVRRKVYIESVSQDQLMDISDERQKQLAAIPAIQPLSNKRLTALASGFGLRMHPVYKVIKMHTGIDFSSPIGTPVYATADGVVIAADTAVRGYGRIMIIDHGYGYQTRYAHLSQFKARVGEHVKRGVPIAYSGNSGVSTAPHLHYEVLLKGTQIDPVHYFFNDLSPADYEKIVELASVENQSLGN
jgi:murein DD-endopeptidase MepM/ murein hydrolase activator NlpD